MIKAMVTSCNAGFLDGAEALLRGSKRFHPDVVRYCFVPDGEIGLAGERLGALAKVMPLPRRIRGVPDGMQINVARVFMVTVPADVVAYVDADALFCRPAPALFDVRKGRVNAVADAALQVSYNVSGEDRAKFEEHFPQTASRKGFNSGVLSLSPLDWPSLPEILEKAIAGAGFDFSDRILDQPLLNAILLPSVDFLPQEYNCHCLFDAPIPGNARIVHFTSRVKPWMKGFPRHEPAYEYWLKHGRTGVSPLTLFAARLWILVNTPRRHAGRFVRDLLRRRSEMGMEPGACK